MRKKRFKRGGPLRTAALVVFAFMLGVLFAVFLHRFTGIQGEKPLTGEQRTASVKAPPAPPAPPAPSPVEPVEPESTWPPPSSKVAIVIDDMGYGMKKLRELLEVDAPITVSVLPHLKNSRQVALEAHKNGREVILHLPMEPKDSWINNPGKGALLTGMAEEELLRELTLDLEEVPFLSGVNNHMGSKFTEDEAMMRVVLEVLKDKDFYFLDSKTTDASVAGKVARELGVKMVSRSVFLDNRRDEDYIRAQFSKLVAKAEKRGKAVAIGHPYPETIAVLKEIIPRLKQKGVVVVRLSELVE
jgi:polysaccharide deacetylase 2 family uncharacterized protein YibQ